ncbi:MAG: hypothetical protein HN350_10000 [Phycisphaerales bacterium]|jgi:hypothetical protein|nr:hypothetical protein [Phycisphaerales bacterium]
MMQNKLCLAWSILLTLTVCGVTLAPSTAAAGTIIIPAWAFDRGNGRVHADPGVVVTGGAPKPWGWTLEYDVDFPVKGKYYLYVKYASDKARPVEVFFDTRDTGNKFCNGITLSKGSPGQPGPPTSKSSSGRWELLRNRFGGPDSMSPKRNGDAQVGKHTIILASRRPLPNIIALRIESPEEFPADWTPPNYKVRDINSVPEKYSRLIKAPCDMSVEDMRKAVPTAARPKYRGKLNIPACTFDRGNVVIYASPDKYANAGPIIGSADGATGRTTVEYDIDFPVSGDYTLNLRYASPQARPIEVFLDGKHAGRTCNSVTFLSPPRVRPVVTSGESWEAVWCTDDLVTMSVAKGRHTLKLTREGAFPNLSALRLDSAAAFEKGYKQPDRKMPHFASVAVKEQSVFLPPDSVNIGALKLAIEDTIAVYGAGYPRGRDCLKRLSAFEKKGSTITLAIEGKSVKGSRVWAGEEGALAEEPSKTDQALKSLRSDAMLAHPLLKFDKLLFIKRQPYTGHIYEDQHNSKMGGSLCMLSPVRPDGKVTSLVPQFDGGLFGRFDLSYDATKVVFCYKKKPPENASGGKKSKANEHNPFRIYEIRLDPKTGTTVPGSLRQLTFDAESEFAAIKKHFDLHATGGGRGVVGQGFHDTDPVYLPNGNIAFMSARSQRSVFCFVTTVSSLHIMDGDGKNIRCISQGPLTEMGPSVMDDGRIVYTRWEYLDKGLGNGQALWSVRPDGSGVDHVYKNSTMRPSGMIHPRSIPGSRRIVTVANPHCGRQGGAVILIDNRITRRTPAAMTSITPEIAYPCMYHSIWHMGYFLAPYPLSEKFFLVSHVPGAKSKKDKPKYGIYALDAWGNRARIYGDPEISCFQPIPLCPRPKPTNVAPVDLAEARQDTTCTMFIQNVYNGMTGIKKGRVKYIRVMGVLPWPWDEHGIFRIGLPGAVHRKKVYGVVKVHQDGSAHFKVPAEQNIFFQALDENYMQLQHMPTFINMRPGEKRSCIGCHEHRKQAPRATRNRPMATAHPIQSIVAQPGSKGPYMVHYATDVQAALDKHCIKCHSGQEPKARLDLTGAPTNDWCKSYEQIVGKGLVSVRNCGFGRSQYVPQPPLSYGSHLSRMVAKMQADPCKGKLSRHEFIRMVTWMDANAPYYGTYRGKRDIKDKDAPDFRPPPLYGKLAGGGK